MLEKIISGGQTGADQGALDAALKLGIPHGGWITKGRRTEAGPLPSKYHLREMHTGAYRDRTHQNVRSADGTLILSHGTLRGGSLETRRFAQKCGKPWLHIDFSETSAFDAAALINDWLEDYRIKILNVAGPRASQDPGIYQATLDILQAVYFLNLTEANLSRPDQLTGASGGAPLHSPRSIPEAAERIIADMSLKDRVTLANLRPEELAPLQMTLGLYIQEQVARWSVDAAFQRACVLAAEDEQIDATNLTMVIIKAVWKQLKRTHRLRTVK